MTVAAPAYDKPCPACSFKNRREAKFCGDCGRPMAGGGGGMGATIAWVVGLAVAGGGLLGSWKMSGRSGTEPWQHPVHLAHRASEPPAVPAPEPEAGAPEPAPAPEARSGEAEQARLAQVAAHAVTARELMAEKKYMEAIGELKQANALGGSPEVDALLAEIANPAPASARPEALSLESTPPIRCFCIRMLKNSSESFEILNQGSSRGCRGMPQPVNSSGLLTCDDVEQCDKLVPLCLKTHKPQCTTALGICFGAASVSFPASPAAKNESAAKKEAIGTHAPRRAASQSQRDWARCCADAGGSWRWGPEKGACSDAWSCQDTWGCCMVAGYDESVASCRAAECDAHYCSNDMFSCWSQ